MTYLRECVKSAIDVLHIDVDKVLVGVVAVGWATALVLAFVSLYHFALALL